MKNLLHGMNSAGIRLLWLWLALTVQAALAATSVTNTATIAPPVGVTDVIGGCDTAVPPNCTGNNTSTVTAAVWSATLTKSASPASGTVILPGSLVTYTLSVNVTGAVTSSPVVLTDTLGTGLSFGAITANAGGFTANTASNPLSFTLPAGAAIGIHTIQYTAQVAANATGSVGNSVVGAGNCTAAAPCTTSHPLGALTVGKQLTAESGSQTGIAEPGETLTYTITITNSSGTAVSNYALTDTLGAGLTFSSATLGGVRTGQNVNWTNLSIPANGSLQVTVVATVDSPIATASVRNLAKRTGDPDPACGSAACVVTPTATSVTVAKTSNPASGTTVIPGQTITYTLTATVTGASTTSANVITDTLGAGQTFGSVVPGSIFALGGTGNVRTFTMPAGTAAGTYSVSYTAAVNAGAAAGSVTNSVSGVPCTTAGGCTTDHPVGAIGITKALTGESGSQAGTAEAGEQLSYTLTLSNPTATAVSGYALTDTLSAGLSFVSASLGGVNSGQNVNWSNLTIPANGTLQVTVVALVGPIGSINVSNLAKPTGGPDPACPSAACVVTPTTSTVTVAKTANTASGTTVIPGQTLTYTLTATVTGANTTGPTVLTDTMSAGQTYVGVSSAGGFTVGTVSPLVHTFTLPANTPAGTYAVSYTVTVNAGATGALGNSVSGVPCSAGGVCTTTHPVGAIGVAKALAAESGSRAGIAEPGETLTYTITLSNPAAAPVTGYALTDILSAGLSYVSSTSGGVNAGQTTNWSGLTIPSNGTLAIMVVATVNTPITLASVSNLAKQTGDPDPGCPSVACVQTPTASTVTVAKSSFPATGTPAIAGQTITYTIIATVTGGKTTTPTVFTDTLGSGQTFGSVTAAGVFTVGGSGNTRTFTLPSNSMAGTYWVSYTATVNAGAVNGTVNNSVTGAPCTTVGECTTDHPVGSIGVAKALTGESGSQAGIAEPSETLTYTITLTNPTGAPVTNYALTDVLSAGLSYASSTPGGVNSGQTTSWTNLTIPANSSLQVKVLATVNTPITVASIRNLAKPTGDPDPTCPGAACVVTPTASSVTVAKTSSPTSGTPVLAGQAITYTLTATVSGGNTTAPTVFTDTLGGGQTFGTISPTTDFTFGGAGNTRTFTLPAGQPAGTYSVTYTATVNAGASSSVNNAVTGVPCTPAANCTTTHPVGAIGITKALTGESGSQAGTAEAGEQLSYTLTLSNPTATAVSGYALTDTLSAGLSFVSASLGGVNSGQNVNWSNLTIPANGTLQVTVVALVGPIGSINVSNLAKPTGGPDPACPSAACVVTPTTSTVTVAKTANTASGTTVIPGQTLTYTLTATVTGANTTGPTVLTDTMSAGQTYVGVSSAGGFTVGTVSPLVHTFTLPANTPAGTYAVSYTVTVNAGATGALGNSVSGVPCSAGGVCTTTHPVGAIGVAKALAAESGSRAGIAEPGETLTYTITLSNPAAAPVTGYALTDILSAGLSYVSSTSGGVNAGQTTSWSGLTIPSNGTLAITVVATVNTPITLASVSNLAKQTGDPDPGCPSVACVQTPTASTVTVAKASNPATGATVIAGQTITYTLTATVTGGKTTAPTVFTDTLGSGQTFGSVTAAGAFTVGGSGNTRTFTLPSDTVAGTYAVSYTATVNAGAVNGTVNNSVTGAPCTTVGGCTTDHPVGSIGVAKALTGESGSQAGIAEPGETLTYTITLTNTTGAPVTNYALTDVRSPGLTYVSSSPTGANAGQTTSWTGLTIPANGTLQLTIVFTVNSPITTANVSNLAKPTGGPDPACPGAACPVVPTVSTVTVAKTSSPPNGSTVIPGQSLSYTLTVTVIGGDTTSPTVLTDTMGSGQTFGSVGANAGFGFATISALVHTFTLPQGTPAGTYSVTYTTTVNAGATTGSVDNAVTGANCATIGSCATDHPVGAITVTKALTGESGSQAGTAEAGEQLSYTLTLSNPTATAVSGYALTDTLSAGLSFVSASLGGVNSGQNVNWSNLTIPANGTLQVTVVALVGPIGSINVSNLAKPTGGPDPACPSAACVVTPTTSTVTVAKTANTASGTTVIPGQTLTYTLTATVTGANTTGPTVLTDTMSAGQTYVGVSSAGGFTVGTVSPLVHTFTLPANTPAGTYAVSYTVTVNAGATGALGNSVSGVPCSAGGVCTTTHPVGAIGVAKALAAESGSRAGIAEPGETLTYTITLSNPAAAPVTGYALTDILSAGLSYVSSTSGGVNAGQTTNWSGLTIPSNGTLAIMVVATVNTPITLASVSNLAKQTGDPDPGCPSVACVQTPTASTVTVAKSSFPATGTPAIAGQTITYTIIATVTGGKTTTPTVFTDTLGSGQTFGSVTAAGVFTVGGSGNTRTFTLPSNSMAGTYWVSYTATVNAGAVNGTVNNSVTGAPCTTVGECTTDHPVGSIGVAKALTAESITTNGIAEPGELLTYTITLTNPTGAAVTGYALTDRLSTGLTYSSSTPVGANSGQTTDWTGLTIPANGSIQLTLVATVNTPLTTVNVSNLAKPAGGIDPACPGAGCVVTPTSSVVTVAKTSNPATGAILVAGQTVSYTLTVTVSGANTGAATVLTDTLGGGQTFGSVTSVGAFTVGTVSPLVHTFTLPAGQPAGTYSVTYTATVNAGASGSVNNAVTGVPCTPAANCTTTHPVGAIGITKALTGESGSQAGTAEAGEQLSYTLTLSNPTATAVSGYALTDTLSAGLSFVSASLGGVNSGQNVNWSNLTIPANGTLQVTVVALVGPIGSINVSNLAKPTGGPDPACPSAACVVTPTTSTVTVAKTANTASGTTVIPGQTLTYTLTATVTGANTTGPTVLTDTMSAGQTYVGVSSAGGFTVGTVSPLVHTFTLPANTPAGTYAVSYTVTVNAGATGALGNSVSGVPCSAGGVCTTTHPVGAIGVAKALAAESGSRAGIAEPGETLTYTITLSNPAAAPVTGYALTDILSAGLSYVSSTSGGVNAGQTTSWSGLTIPSNGTLAITVVATVNTPITLASVSNLAKQTGDPDPGCPSVACAQTPTASTVTMSKTSNPVNGVTVIAGQTLTYTLSVRVSGGDTTTATVLTDTLGSGQTFGSLTPGSQFAMSGAGNTRTFTLPAGVAAGTYSVSYTALVNAGAVTGTVNNAVTSSNATCETAGACATNHPIGAIGLNKALTGESIALNNIAQPGEQLTYTITLTNPTGIAVTGYALTDTLSAGLTYVSSSLGGVNSGQSVNWTNLSIPANGLLQVTVVALVNPIATASVSNLAKPSGAPDPSCPSAACVVTPTMTTVTVAKSSNPAPGTVVIPGQTITYTLTATVIGADTATPTVLTDTLGSGQTFGSMTPTANFSSGGSGNVRTFTLLAGRAAGTYSVTYTATVNAGATTGLVNNAVSGVPCSAVGACQTDHPVGAVSVNKVLTGESINSNGVAEAGELLTYTITLVNPSTATVTGYALTDRLGTGLTYVSSTLGGVNAGQTTTWASLTVPANGTLQVIVVARVNVPIATAAVSNLAKPTGGVDPACPSSGCVVIPTASTVSVAKVANPPNGTPVIAGQTITYTLTATVSGSATGSPVVLTDTLGSGQSFGSVIPGSPFAAAGAGNVRTFTLPTNTVAGSYTVSYTATVNAGAVAGTVSNVVTGATCTSGGVCATDHPVGAISLAKALTAESGSQAGIAEPGETLTYTITLTNPTPAPVTAYALTDALGAGLSYVSSTLGGVNAGQTTNWAGLTIPASGSLQVNLLARVNAPITTESVRNIAKSTGSADPACPSAGCVTVPTSSTVTLTKLSNPASGATVMAGQTITYTLTATVVGSPTPAATVLTDTMGSGQTFGAVTSAGVYSAAGTGNARSFTLPAGTVAGTYSLTYTATVNAAATTGTVNNVVTGAACAAPGACATDHPVGAVTLTKALTAESLVADGIAQPGEQLSYTITLANPSTVAVTGYALTDVLSPGLTYVSSTPGGANAGQTTNWPALTIPANGTLQVSVVAKVDTTLAVASIHNVAKPTGAEDPACPSAACVVNPTAADVKPSKQLTAESGSRPGVAEPGERLTYTITLANAGGAPWNNYRFTENVPAGATMTGVTGASGLSGPITGPGAVNLTVPQVPGGGAATVTVMFVVADSLPSGMTVLPNLINGGDIDPTCVSACTVSVRVEEQPQVSIVKTAAVREARIGDLVRYTLTITNTGTVDMVNGRVIDTPPAGFSYVAGSAAVADGDGAFTLGAGASPLQFGGIDIAAGKQAVITYLLRVGAGVRQGSYANHANAVNTIGRAISNVASAEVQVVADPMVDESLILGTVFNDLDGDGWQDTASLSGVRVQGGFEPGVYVPGSTRIDRGHGAQPEPDASAPMLHGIDLGSISARQSEADPAENHRVVIRQQLTALAFTGDFVLTSKEGVTVRMDAAGRTTVEKTGDAAEGLNGAAPTVERRVSLTESGYVVEYVITNTGIEERGIPGVRIASVEGVLIETDQYGRYNLTGVSGGDWNRGRNFILKVDPNTLPAGAEFTTANPLVRRITPGLPVRFDYGVRLPQEQLKGVKQVAIELGEVIFAPGSSEVRKAYLPAIEKMAARINEYEGGEVLIRANGESQVLALGRAQAVQDALQSLVSPKAAKALRITARTELTDPQSLVVGVQQQRLMLGSVLFDTAKWAIRPEFEPMLQEVAQTLAKREGGVVTLVGHADVRGTDAYNLDLGMCRAKAVLDAILPHLPPSLRAKVRVEPPRDAPPPASGRLVCR
ncbi:isopeptide-forming domain-containing fimbrial protein [Rhodoferax koreensis]|nr:isopeptide-forming domain-containing fimbrial protein [Rhodoferax koreense]